MKFRSKHPSALIAFFLVWVVLLALTGCKVYKHESTHGVFTLTQWLSERNEGNINAFASRLCSSIDGHCMKAVNIVVTPERYDPAHPWIAVAMDDGSKDKATLTFLNAATGERLVCANCRTDSASAVVSPESIEWPSTAASDAAFGFALEGDQAEKLVVVEFSRSTYAVTELGMLRNIRLQPRVASIGPGKSGVAWFDCATSCELHTFDRLTRSTTTAATPCIFDPRYGHEIPLAIGWTNPPAARAFPEYGSEVRSSDRCFRADGQPVYPTEAKPAGQL